MTIQPSYALEPTPNLRGASRTLKRFLAREDLRQHPLTGICRRIAWRFRWQVSQNPWLIQREDGLPLFLPHSGAAALIYFQGSSEPELSVFLKRFLKPGMVFADVGAHLGEYTVLAASLLNGSGRVHAFEACPRCFRVLSRNIELNALQNAVALPWAVWNQEGFCEFEDSPDPSISALRPNRTPIQGGKITRVKAIALDHYFGDSDNGAPTLIKVDVEGAELQVLEGARNLLSSPQAPDVVVEYGPLNTARFGYRADDICAFMREMGYSIFQWAPGGALVPVQGCPILPPHGDSCNLLATKTPSRLESLYPELDRRPSPAGGVDGFPDAARSRFARERTFKGMIQWIPRVGRRVRNYARHRQASS